MSAADEQDPKDEAPAEAPAKKPARAPKAAAAKDKEPTDATEQAGAGEVAEPAKKPAAKAKAAKAKEPAAEGSAKAEKPAKAEESAAAKGTSAEKPAAKAPSAKKPAKESAAKRPAAKATGPDVEAKAAPPAAKSKPAASGAKTTARRPTVRAHARYVRTSARKARMVCGHLRGKSVQEARAILAFTPRDAARDWSKLLESAVANAENNHELLEDDLVVREAYADEGPTIKRFRPRAMGRATPIRKRTSHLTITLTPGP
jgi:ribosomal protein L22